MKNKPKKTPKNANRKKAPKKSRIQSPSTRGKKDIGGTGKSRTKKIQSVSTPKKRVQPVNKRTRAKNVSKRTPRTKQITAKIVRGKNTMDLTGRGKPENLAKRLDSADIDKPLDYLLKKNKPIKGKPAKEPRAVVVIKTIITDDGVKKTYSTISDPDFVVNKKNVKKFVKSSVKNAGGELEEFYGSELSSVSKVSIKFIY